jgi:hypothetical protein
MRNFSRVVVYGGSNLVSRNFAAREHFSMMAYNFDGGGFDQNEYVKDYDFDHDFFWNSDKFDEMERRLTKRDKAPLSLEEFYSGPHSKYRWGRAKRKLARDIEKFGTRILDKDAPSEQQAYGGKKFIRRYQTGINQPLTGTGMIKI